MAMKLFRKMDRRRDPMLGSFTYAAPRRHEEQVTLHFVPDDEDGHRFAVRGTPAEALAMAASVVQALARLDVMLQEDRDPVFRRHVAGFGAERGQAEEDSERRVMIEMARLIRTARHRPSPPEMVDPAAQSAHNASFCGAGPAADRET